MGEVMRDPIEEAAAELHALANLCAELPFGGPAIVLRLYADDDIRRLGLRSVTDSLARCVINTRGEARAAYQMAYDAIAAIEARVACEREAASCPL